MSPSPDKASKLEMRLCDPEVASRRRLAREIQEMAVKKMSRMKPLANASKDDMDNRSSHELDHNLLAFYNLRSP